MMYGSNRWRWLYLLISLCCTCASAYLGWYYFNFKTEPTNTVFRTLDEFYKPQRLQWVAPDVYQILADIEGGNPDGFNLMVARTALTRYRVQHIAPNAFEALMSEYDRGLWIGKQGEAWREGVREIDRRWIKARQYALRLNQKPLVMHREGRHNDGFSFKFEEGWITSQIGSHISIEVLLPRGVKVSGHPELFWQTDVTNAVDPKLRRIPNYTEKVTTSGETLVVLDVDMSADALWLVPDTRPTYFFLRLNNIGLGDVTKVYYSDSPRLPIPEVPK